MDRTVFGLYDNVTSVTLPDTITHITDVAFNSCPDLQNIYVDADALKSTAVVNILWHKMSFTTRCNFQPQALYREDGRHIFSNRIMAIRGNYHDIIKEAKDREDEIVKLLENEIASLYVPPDQNQKCIFKIKHTGQEFTLNQTDAPREFVLKVVETVCGGGLYHQDGSVKTFIV